MASQTQKLSPSQTARRDFGLVALAFVLWWFIFTNLQIVVDFVTYRILGLDAADHLGTLYCDGADLEHVSLAITSMRRCWLPSTRFFRS